MSERYEETGVGVGWRDAVNLLSMVALARSDEESEAPWSEWGAVSPVRRK